MCIFILAIFGRSWIGKTRDFWRISLSYKNECPIFERRYIYFVYIHETSCNNRSVVRQRRSLDCDRNLCFHLRRVIWLCKPTSCWIYLCRVAIKEGKTSAITFLSQENWCMMTFTGFSAEMTESAWFCCWSILVRFYCNPTLTRSVSLRLCSIIIK